MADQLDVPREEPGMPPIGEPGVPVWESAPDAPPPDAPLALPSAPVHRPRADKLLLSLAVVGGLVLIIAPFLLAGVGGADLFTAAPASPVAQFHSPPATTSSTATTTSPPAASSSPATASDLASGAPFTAPPATKAKPANGAPFTAPAAAGGPANSKPTPNAPTPNAPTPSGSTPSTSMPTWSGYDTFKAVYYSAQSGDITPETCSDTGGGQDIGSIAGGAWVLYKNVDFGSTIPASRFFARVASFMGKMNARVDIRLDSRTSAPIGGFAVTNTGGWQSWTTVSVNTTPVTGIHDVYLTITSDQWGYVLNINWFTFTH